MKGHIKFILFLFLYFYSTQYCWAIANFTYDIIGIQGEALDNARNRLFVIQKTTKRFLTPPEIQRLYKRGNKQLLKAIQPYGYFKAKVSSQLIYEKGSWKAIYYVTAGEPLQITQIETKVTGPGTKEVRLSQLVENNPLKPGDIFNVPNYENFKKKLFQAAKNRGYLQAAYNNKIEVDLAKYTCDIIIELMTGPQFYFGKITFKNHPYAEAFLQRFIRWHEGDVFSSDKILRLQRRMEKSYYFNRVVFKPDFQNNDSLKIPIDAYLYAPSAKSYSFGLGYGTLTGPRLSGALSLRHIGDYGHHVEAELKLSKVLSGIGATYYIPGNNPLTDEWLTGVNYKVFSPKAGKSYSKILTLGYSKKFSKLQNNFTLNYLSEKFTIYEFPFYQNTQTFYPSWKLTYINADNLINPTKAYSVNFTLQAGTNKLASAMSFIQAQARAKAIFSPFTFSRLILRTDLGVISTNNLARYPFSMRFFAGGVNSIRGFADSSIGPGRYLGTASAEYQHRLKGDWYGAVFYDLGNASNHMKQQLNRGTGFGMVYNTRVGPLKIYFARALSKATKPNSIEFSVGPEFS